MTIMIITLALVKIIIIIIITPIILSNLWSTKYHSSCLVLYDCDFSFNFIFLVSFYYYYQPFQQSNYITFA
jgi:hypothetical protein